MDIYTININAITAVGVSLLVLLVLVGIIIWSVKTRAQTQALQSIDSKMAQASAINIEIQNETQSQPDETVDEEEEANIALENKEEEQEAPEEELPKVDCYRTGKSGKVYTEEELVQLIKN